MAKLFPDHWHKNSWEEKARENPLNAIMTGKLMLDADATEFSPEHLEEFFAKGVRIFEEHLQPLLGDLPDQKEKALLVEYGCGAGRILKAIHQAGYRCCGIDISETMLGHCQRLVPEVEKLYLLDEKGRCSLPSGCASLVFTNAVVQHIESLRKYTVAFDEMCRILKPGGILAAQVNCEDYTAGDLTRPERTENFEDYSLHYKPGETEPYLRHDQDTWTGVYIGERNLRRMLAERGVIVKRHYYRDTQKRRAIWFVARKRSLLGLRILAMKNSLRRKV